MTRIFREQRTGVFCSFAPVSMEGNIMKEKDLLEQLKQMRDSTQEAIKWLDMPPS